MEVLLNIVYVLDIHIYNIKTIMLTCLFTVSEVFYFSDIQGI